VHDLLIFYLRAGALTVTVISKSRRSTPDANLGYATEIPSQTDPADDGAAHITFNFGDPGNLQEDHADLSLAQRADFTTAFYRDLTSFKAWSAIARWTPSVVPDLQVSVSNSFKTSRALLPAWEGRHGRMEFPTWRVAARKAAITHELVHVYYPNGNRFLAEGLAIYVQALIGGNPAFPNFGRALHAQASDVICEMVPDFSPGNALAFAVLRLADLERIATPNPLALQVGSTPYGVEPRGQARLYSIAGSFIQFLIETRGLGKFRELYACTPLIPSQQNAGDIRRWSDVYGRPFEDFESEWKTMLARQQARRS
jgi:hypothetical protein